MDCSPKCPFYSLPSLIEDFHARVRQAVSDIASNPKVKKEVAAAAAQILPSVDTLPDLIANHLQAFRICLKCSHTSNDDNPTNHGQTFISRDSVSISPKSGKSTRPNADWIDAQAYQLSAPQDSPADLLAVTSDYLASRQPSHSVTLLPADIEDALRRHLSDFAALDIFDKILVCSQIQDKPMSFGEFARFKWIPRVMRTKQEISKQAVSVRWHKIVERMPIVTALQHGQIGNGTKVRKRPHRSAAKKTVRGSPSLHHARYSTDALPF